MRVQRCAQDACGPFSWWNSPFMYSDPSVGFKSGWGSNSHAPPDSYPHASKCGCHRGRNKASSSGNHQRRQFPSPRVRAMWLKFRACSPSAVNTQSDGILPANASKLPRRKSSYRRTAQPTARACFSKERNRSIRTAKSASQSSCGKPRGRASAANESSLGKASLCCTKRSAR